jgi:hypothetical protein
MTFQNIARGEGQIDAYGQKKLSDTIICQDGTELSVQASRYHYCTPRTDSGPYTHLEVGFPSVDPPETWATYADGEYPADVYGYVPVALIQTFISAHGGEK